MIQISTIHFVMIYSTETPTDGEGAKTEGEGGAKEGEGTEGEGEKTEDAEGRSLLYSIKMILFIKM